MLGHYIYKAIYSGCTSLSFIIMAADIHADGLFKGPLSETDLKVITLGVVTSIVTIVMEYNDSNKKNPNLSIVLLTPIICFCFVWLMYEYTMENGISVAWALILTFFVGLISLEVVRFIFLPETRKKLRAKLNGIFFKENGNGAIE